MPEMVKVRLDHNVDPLVGELLEPLDEYALIHLEVRPGDPCAYPRGEYYISWINVVYVQKYKEAL